MATSGADGSDVPAFLVVPAKGSPRAGILFLHWLGDDFSSRDEFVEEAVALAGQGVESLLITQHFPWSERPAGVASEWYAVICRTFTPIESVASSNTRSKLRRGLRNCEARRISCEELAGSGYEP